MKIVEFDQNSGLKVATKSVEIIKRHNWKNDLLWSCQILSLMSVIITLHHFHKQKT